MEDPIGRMRAAVHALALSLDAHSIALVSTSRGLEAIIDKASEWRVRQHRWYALLGLGGHIYAVADINGKRVSLQRYVMTLADPTLTFTHGKQISFANKLSLDCRVCNLENHVGRQAVMRNRRPKSNTSSKYKGVSRLITTTGEVKWKVAIKADTDAIFLGSYDSEDWAAMVYDAAAYLLFDGAALYNLPELCPNSEALNVAAERIERIRYIQAARTQRLKTVGLNPG